MNHRRATKGRAAKAIRWMICAVAVTLCISGLSGTAQGAAGSAQRSPNVLWIIAEDMSPDLGVYGTRQVETPHLDRLAQRGMRFTQAFATAPSCSPSRSAFNTVVFFFSDHGRPFLRGKQWAYDSGLRVPLLVYWPDALGEAPRQYAAGSATDRLVSLIDVTATTLTVAGVEPPEAIQGRAFLGPAADAARSYVFGAADRQGEVQLRSRTVRTDRYRYIRNGFPERPLLAATAYRKETHPLYHLVKKLRDEDRLLPEQQTLVQPRPAEELYDLEADPYELRNLAGSPAHQNVLSELRGVLDDWVRRTNDRGQQPDAPAVVRYFEAYGERSARQRAERIEAMHRRVYQADDAYLERARQIWEMF